MRRISARRKALFAAAVTLGVVVVVDGGFRLYEAHRAARRPTIHVDDPLCGYRMKPGLTGTPTTNSLGHRGRELSPHKPPGAIRIACLGGSTTYGYGALEEDEPYPAVLERLLAAAAPGREVEVFNAGVQGWSSRTSIDNFAARLAPLGFDIVIIKHAYNDLYESWHPGYVARSHRPPGELQEPGWLEWLARSSGFLRWAVRKAQESALARKRETHSPDGLAAFERNLKASVAFVRGVGARPVLCTYPSVFPEREEEAAQLRFKGYDVLEGTLKRSPLSYRGLVEGLRAYSEGVRRVARAEAVDLIDLEALFPPNPELYVDFIHQDGAGMQVLASHIAQHIVRAGWLEGAGEPSGR